MVFPIAKKSFAAERLIELINLISKSHPVIELRSDPGGEFMSGQLDTFCREKGIVCSTSNTDTPQQNGVAEHLNCVLLEHM